MSHYERVVKCMSYELDGYIVRNCVKPLESEQFFLSQYYKHFIDFDKTLIIEKYLEISNKTQ